jgi:hypothetical protein
MHTLKLRNILSEYKTQNEETYTHIYRNNRFVIPNKKLKIFFELYSQSIGNGGNGGSDPVLEKRNKNFGPIAINLNIESFGKKIKIKTIDEIVGVLLKILIGIFGPNEFAYVIIRNLNGIRIIFPFTICDFDNNVMIKKRFIENYGKLNEQDYDYESDWMMFGNTDKIIKMSDSTGSTFDISLTLVEKIELVSILKDHDDDKIYPIKQNTSKRKYEESDIKLLLRKIAPIKNDQEWLKVGRTLYILSAMDIGDDIDYFKMFVKWSKYGKSSFTDTLVENMEKQCRKQWEILAIKYEYLSQTSNGCLFKQISRVMDSKFRVKIIDIYLMLSGRKFKSNLMGQKYVLYELNEDILLYHEVDLVALAQDIKKTLIPYIEILDIIYSRKAQKVSLRHDNKIESTCHINDEKEKRKTLKAIDKNIDKDQNYLKSDMISAADILNKIKNPKIGADIVKMLCLSEDINDPDFIKSLDKDRGYINFINHKMNLKTGANEFRTEDDRYCKYIKTEYDEDIEIIDIEDEISAWCGHNDKIQSACLELLAYRLSGDIDRFNKDWKVIPLPVENKQKLLKMGDLYELEDVGIATAMFDTLIGYSMKYYKKGKFSHALSEDVGGSEKVVDSVKDIECFMKKYYVKTENRHNKIYKKDILKKFHEYSRNTNIELRPFIGIMQSIGYSYDRQTSMGYKNPKGCFFGLIEK